ncbi:MAG: hypothetical protein M1829_000059 [Trizodia sp. TS-e1964]|nr:MAG: hypothetical protein M1829_000059 [Trizodia sp. TS-e1964]
MHPLTPALLLLSAICALALDASLEPTATAPLCEGKLMVHARESQKVIGCVSPQSYITTGQRPLPCGFFRVESRGPDTTDVRITNHSELKFSTVLRRRYCKLGLDLAGPRFRHLDIFHCAEDSEPAASGLAWATDKPDEWPRGYLMVSADSAFTWNRKRVGDGSRFALVRAWEGDFVVTCSKAGDDMYM